MGKIRIGVGEESSPCREARWALCRLAVGGELGPRGLELAAHVTTCPPCDRFVDELAAVRRHLGADGGGSRPSDRQPRRLALRARAALARELEARLARDLLAQAAGEVLRPRASRWQDVLRLDGLRPCSRLGDGDWARVRRAVLEQGHMPRGLRLQLASVLDGSGLDVALAWLGFLVRSGHEGRARREADRLLAEVEP